MKFSAEQWSLDALHKHLQYAVDLELWTIPFYMSAMYSIKDRSSDAYQLIRTVVNQEMLHLQSAANIANAYGLKPSISVPTYEGQTVPHIDFSGDDPAEIDKFKPYTAEIGPLDLKHINAMCLIEIPDYLTKEEPDFNDEVSEYGSIGEFYEALEYGAAQLTKYLHGGVNQVEFFAAYYRNAPGLTVTDDGDTGFNQVKMLIDLITDQGEGVGKTEQDVPLAFQNTADDIQPEDDHFEKFLSIKENGDFPEVFKTKSPQDYTEADKKLEAILIEQFAALTKALEALFNGESPKSFFPIMASVGGAIRNCWENGVTPKFGN